MFKHRNFPSEADPPSVDKKLSALFADHVRRAVKFIPSLAGLTALAFAFAQTASADSTNRYVAWNSATAAVPYTNWITAASNIQDAIDAALVSDVIWVSNGVYETGGLTNYPTGGLLTNRVVIDKAITVRSANNDPANTIIKGAWDPATNGPAAVRCVYLSAGASLIGFMVTNGATLTTGTDDQYGGGVYYPSTGATISNCVIAGNSAYFSGGGAYFYGSVFNCTIVGNTVSRPGGPYSYGGGMRGSSMFNCTIVGNYSQDEGGGASYSTLSNCTLSGNSAGVGAGAQGSSLYNCLLIGNAASYAGGGAIGSTLYSCTIVGNSAASYGGGSYAGVLYNCIVYFNTAPDGSNWYGAISFTNCCTTTGMVDWAAGNITNDPMFVANGSGYGTNHVVGNYRLQASSPCVNTGTNQSWMINSVDLDNRIRIRYGTVDMGCYETIYKGSIYRFGF